MGHHNITTSELAPAAQHQAAQEARLAEVQAVLAHALRLQTRAMLLIDEFEAAEMAEAGDISVQEGTLRSLQHSIGAGVDAHLYRYWRRRVEQLSAD